LYAAGEAVGGANGANRLSGNAITEAFVFGHAAGEAAGHASRRRKLDCARAPAAAALGRLRELACGRPGGATPVALQTELQDLMWRKAGPFRTGKDLAEALERIHAMQKSDLARLDVKKQPAFNLDLQDAFELRAMLSAAEAVVHSALARTESRGAHQREDFPDDDPAFRKNQNLELRDSGLVSRWTPPIDSSRTEASRG
jgi:succinate dehydrogenase/fumarate reductase flavoprotein subunit